jgi:hypothetical protein
MSGKTRNIPTFAGVPPSNVIQLDDRKNRLTIPASVMRAVNWSRKESTTVVAELLDEGRIRLHRWEDIAPPIETLAKQIADDFEGDEKHERLAVLGDRYRPLTIEENGRLIPIEAVLLHLEVTFGEKPYFLIRAFGKNVEILAYRLRKEVNRTYRSDTTPEHD